MKSPKEIPGEPPRVSVIVPCRDAEGTLAVQLQALASQRWEGSWEVIVADNGSADGSRDLVRELAQRWPALRLVAAAETSGPAHARNRGAAASAGDLLLFCDADDEVAPGWVAAMVAALEDADAAASRYDHEALNPAWMAKSRGDIQLHGLNPYTYPPYLPHAGAGGLGVRRAAFAALGGFDESLPALEDTDFCWRLQLAGHRLVFAPEAVVRVRLRSSLLGTFRQGLLYGEYNVLIYARYRPRGMPPVAPAAGLVKWARLLLTVPTVFGRVGRARWIWQLGWRLGRLAGCWRYRVWAP